MPVQYLCKEDIPNDPDPLTKAQEAAQMKQIAQTVTTSMEWDNVETSSAPAPAAPAPAQPPPSNSFDPLPPQPPSSAAFPPLQQAQYGG